MSRKAIAEDFRKWVFGVIKEIRLHGKYELQQEAEQMKLQLEEKTVIEQKLHQQLEEKDQLLEGQSKELVR